MFRFARFIDKAGEALKNKGAIVKTKVGVGKAAGAGSGLVRSLDSQRAGV